MIPYLVLILKILYIQVIIPFAHSAKNISFSIILTFVYSKLCNIRVSRKYLPFRIFDVLLADHNFHSTLNTVLLSIAQLIGDNCDL